MSTRSSTRRTNGSPRRSPGRPEGVTATGKVGDANAALGAIEDELRLFGVDEVIISTYPPGTSNWLETGIVQRLRDELDIPVTHVVVQPEPGSGLRGPAALARFD